MSEAAAIELQVHLARDEETGWWYVADSDIPGLILEAATAAALMQKIELAAPEMIELNLAEILSSGHSEGDHNRAVAELPRPAMAYRPIFDSPFEAYA